MGSNFTDNDRWTGRGREVVYGVVLTLAVACLWATAWGRSVSRERPDPVDRYAVAVTSSTLVALRAAERAEAVRPPLGAAVRPPADRAHG